SPKRAPTFSIICWCSGPIAASARPRCGRRWRGAKASPGSPRRRPAATIPEERSFMAYDPDNVFARILRGEIPCTKIYEDEHTLAFQDISPQARIHALVIPKGTYVSM